MGSLGGGPQLVERERLAVVPEGMPLQLADGHGGEGARQALVDTAVLACRGRGEVGYYGLESDIPHHHCPLWPVSELQPAGPQFCGLRQ